MNFTSQLQQAVKSLPGDKSISHRAVIIASLSEGVSTITHFSESDDCLATVAILQQLGVKIEHPSPGRLIVHGTGGNLTTPTKPLDCGNSGTTMRLLAGVLASQLFPCKLIGDASLSNRPMQRVVEPLTMMGADICATGNKKTPPLFIEGKSLRGIDYELPIASAQVKSALLFAALFAKGTTSIIEPIPCRDHTERMLTAFQVTCSRHEKKITLQGPQIPQSCDYEIPSDLSSAAFWIVAAAASPNAELHIKNIGLNPTRTGILTILQRMGAHLSISQTIEKNNEPSGTLTIKGGRLKGTIIEGFEIPNVIDELPILAVAGAFAQGKTIIKNATELRFKETDRIRALVINLRALGAKILEHDDGFEIEGGFPLKGTTLDSYGDHRIAMAMAIASLFAEGKTIIKNRDCISTSYPEFEKAFPNWKIGDGR